jgi:hypothetical protein
MMKCRKSKTRALLWDLLRALPPLDQGGKRRAILSKVRFACFLVILLGVSGR